MMFPKPVRYCHVCGSELQEQQAFGRLRPVCPSCGHVHFQDPKVAAAVLVIKDGRVLLVRRVNIPHQGKWTLPAGFVEADEDPQDTAIRECYEETGLKVHITGLMDVIAGREHPRGASIVIIYRGEIAGGELKPMDDADAAGFYKPEELPPIAFEATQRALELWRRGTGD